MLQHTIVLALCLTTILVEGQVTLDSCRTKFITPHHFLDKSKFMGVWYNLKIGPNRADQVPAKPTIKCLLANLTQTDDDNVILYQEPYVRLDENGTAIGHEMVESHGVIGTVDPDQPLDSVWALMETTPPNDEPLGHVVIVASDEESWAIEYSCILRANDILERISLWSRSPTMDPEVEKTLDTVMFAAGFPRENILPFDHTGCD